MPSNLINYFWQTWQANYRRHICRQTPEAMQLPKICLTLLQSVSSTYDFLFNYEANDIGRHLNDFSSPAIPI
jgi:hypothetical protein